MPVYVQNPNVQLPYPGLRAFRREEAEIFFGREEHVTRLAEILEQNHFVAVVGPSGCGKSSLVTAGLVPQLEDGHAIPNSGSWHEVTIRPGDRPFARLAESMVASGIFPEDAEADEPSRIGFLDAFLRRGPLGLIETIDTMAPLNGSNLLIVVDQFEEIFRYHQEADEQEADAFVALLLETVRQARDREMPIYIMLTMRSDYFGDCNQFSGLPEEISQSQFLTPRPNREQRHAAIVGPAAMFGGEVEPALVNRLLNDMGDDPDQLPIMQHALMRMWSMKEEPESEQAGAESDEEPIPILTTDLYEEVGGWKDTLSRHADEAFDDLGDDPVLQRTAEVMFRSLTRPGSDQNDVRRPVSVREVADTAAVATDLVKKAAAAFRRSDRSLVMPPLADGVFSGDDLDDEDILDISHESLIRNWQRLHSWASDEAESAATFRRLQDAAQRWKAGQEAHLQSPGLDIALQWKEAEKPTAAWARRYGSDFDLAMEFLDSSLEEKNRRDEKEEARRMELAAERARADEQENTVARVRRQVLVTGVMAALFACSTLFAFHNNRQLSAQEKKTKEEEEKAAAAKVHAELARARAEKARKDVDLQRQQAEAEKKEVLNRLYREQKEDLKTELPKLEEENDEDSIADQILQLTR